MFSANENLVLRAHKRRIIQYVESTIPDQALDMGTTVMVMQVSCRAPGCVPLETIVAVVFPRPPKKAKSKKYLVPGLEESATGGTYKTKILLPMADVTKDDVLDALPPEFDGGRRSMEKLCTRARDVMLGQIGQIVNEDDTEGKKLVVEFLRECLEKYEEGGYATPEVGEPFPPANAPGRDGDEANGVAGDETGRIPSDVDDPKPPPDEPTKEDGTSRSVAAAADGNAEAARKAVTSGTGNFVLRRIKDEVGAAASAPAPDPAGTPSAPNDSRANGATTPRRTETAMDWRRRQNTDARLDALSSGGRTMSAIQRLAAREHAPGVRRPGCPCCDPDDPANVVDGMIPL